MCLSGQVRHWWVMITWFGADKPDQLVIDPEEPVRGLIMHADLDGSVAILLFVYSSFICSKNGWPLLSRNLGGLRNRKSAVVAGSIHQSKTFSEMDEIGEDCIQSCPPGYGMAQLFCSPCVG